MRFKDIRPKVTCEERDIWDEHTQPSTSSNFVFWMLLVVAALALNIHIGLSIMILIEWATFVIIDNLYRLRKENMLRHRMIMNTLWEMQNKKRGKK